MTKEDLLYCRELPDRVIEKYRKNLALIEERMDDIIDQSRVPPDLLNAKVRTEMVIRNKRTDFTPEERLEMLDQLENWYVSQGFPFPNPEYLEKKRAKILPIL